MPDKEHWHIITDLQNALAPSTTSAFCRTLDKSQGRNASRPSQMSSVQPGFSQGMQHEENTRDTIVATELPNSRAEAGPEIHITRPPLFLTRSARSVRTRLFPEDTGPSTRSGEGAGRGGSVGLQVLAMSSRTIPA